MISLYLSIMSIYRILCLLVLLLIVVVDVVVVVVVDFLTTSYFAYILIKQARNNERKFKK